MLGNDEEINKGDNNGWRFLILVPKKSIQLN